MGLLERCQELLKAGGLYEVLGVNKEATEAEIRRGYYKLSLKVHPDRAPEDPHATEKFQLLGKVYAVLSDEEQRAIYDEQGLVCEESDALSQDRCWSDYWRLIFPKISRQKIIDFERKYKGSDEEKGDLLKLYTQHQGDLDIIMECAFFSSQEEEPRLCDIIWDAIRSKEVPEFSAFTKESNKKSRARKRRADREKQEAEELQRELGLDEVGLDMEDNGLAMMIQQRQKSRVESFDGFLSGLEAKYCKKKGKSQKSLKGKKK
ncbi:dnaJ homolog subfamily C member 9 [Nerophis lumbriciformis]|uniref:dnaJ homolog subfamily C member 9 n=1 Tax=Nerophis lumbriciformis TaxID=546530 RepID=UPI002AE03EB1|nr:dnaJ homolog subfamily C member 9-like [Nerophis lumbriciformis]